MLSFSTLSILSSDPQIKEISALPWATVTRPGKVCGTLFVIRRQWFAVTAWRASVLWCEGCILGRNCEDCVQPSAEIILKTLQSNCSLNNDFNLTFEVKKKKDYMK